MTPQQFTETAKKLGLTQGGLCRALGIAPNTGTAYANGRVAIPKHIHLACAALLCGIEATQDDA